MGIDFCNATERMNVKFLFQESGKDMDIKPLYKYLCPVIMCLCFINIVFNGILISISKQSRVVNKSPILLLSLNLAMTDLIASLLNGLAILFNSYLTEVEGVDMKDYQCPMLKFEVVRCAALVASALHLLALAFVHYKGIVNPLHYRSTIFFSQHLSRTINIISVACWLLPLTIMIVWFSSTPCQGFQTAECDYLFLLGFTYRYMVLTLFALPLLLMSLIYLRIFIIISRHQKGRRANLERSTLSRAVLSAVGPFGSATLGSRVNLASQLLDNDQSNRQTAPQDHNNQDDEQDDDYYDDDDGESHTPCAACAARGALIDENSQQSARHKVLAQVKHKITSNKRDNNQANQEHDYEVDLNDDDDDRDFDEPDVTYCENSYAQGAFGLSPTIHTVQAQNNTEQLQQQSQVVYCEPGAERVGQEQRERVLSPTVEPSGGKQARSQELAVKSQRRGICGNLIEQKLTIAKNQVSGTKSVSMLVGDQVEGEIKDQQQQHESGAKCKEVSLVANGEIFYSCLQKRVGKEEEEEEVKEVEEEKEELKWHKQQGEHSAAAGSESRSVGTKLEAAEISSSSACANGANGRDKAAAACSLPNTNSGSKRTLAEQSVANGSERFLLLLPGPPSELESMAQAEQQQQQQQQLADCNLNRLSQLSLNSKSSGSSSSSSNVGHHYQLDEQKSAELGSQSLSASATNGLHKQQQQQQPSNLQRVCVDGVGAATKQAQPISWECTCDNKLKQKREKQVGRTQKEGRFLLTRANTIGAGSNKQQQTQTTLRRPRQKSTLTTTTPTAVAVAQAASEQVHANSRQLVAKGSSISAATSMARLTVSNSSSLRVRQPTTAKASVDQCSSNNSHSSSQMQVSIAVPQSPAGRLLRRANTSLTLPASATSSSSRLQQLQRSLRNKLSMRNQEQQQQQQQADFVSSQVNSSFAIITPAASSTANEQQNQQQLARLLTGGAISDQQLTHRYPMPISSSPSYNYEPTRRHVHASAVPQTNTKALVTTLLILGTYFISYVPAITYQVLTCIDKDSCPYPLYTIPISRRVLYGAITTLMLIAKSSIDPFIYTYRMSEIQVVINRYLSKRRSKSSSMAPSMQTNNSQRITHLNQQHHNNNNNQASNSRLTTVDVHQQSVMMSTRKAVSCQSSLNMSRLKSNCMLPAGTQLKLSAYNNNNIGENTSTPGGANNTNHLVVAADKTFNNTQKLGGQIELPCEIQKVLAFEHSQHEQQRHEIKSQQQTPSETLDGTKMSPPVYCITNKPTSEMIMVKSSDKLHDQDDVMGCSMFSRHDDNTATNSANDDDDDDDDAANLSIALLNNKLLSNQMENDQAQRNLNRIELDSSNSKVIVANKQPLTANGFTNNARQMVQVPSATTTTKGELKYSPNGLLMSNEHQQQQQEHQSETIVVMCKEEKKKKKHQENEINLFKQQEYRANEAISLIF